MGWLQNVLGLKSGTEQSNSGSLIPAGRFYVHRHSSNAKARRECIYLEAEAAIQKKLEFQHELVISRSFSDGTTEVSELDDDFSKSFLIDESLNFILYRTFDEGDDEEQSAPKLAFSWVDPASPESSYEFIVDTQVDGCSSHKIGSFETKIYACMWERKYQTSADGLAVDDVYEFKIDSQPTSSQEQQSTAPPLFREPTPESDDGQLEPPPDNDSPDDSDDDDDVDDQNSESSGDDIANQLKAVNLVDKSGSAPIPEPELVRSPPRVERSKVNTPSRRVSGPHSVKNTSLASPSTSKVAASSQSPALSLNTPPKSTPVKTVTPTKTPEARLPATKKVEVFTDETNRPATNLTQLCWQDTCDLWLFDAAMHQFRPYQKGTAASLWVAAPGNPQKDLCWLSVLGHNPDTDELVSHVSTNLGVEQSLSFQSGSIIFNYIMKDPDSDQPRATHTWLLAFPGDEQTRDRYTAAQDAFTKAIFDRDNGIGSFEKSSAADREWNRITHGVVVEPDDVEMADGEIIEEEEEEEEESEEEDETSSDEEDPETKRKSDKHKNSTLAVGYKEDLSFVVRGNMIGVFKNAAGGSKKLKFMASIPGMTTPDGKRDLLPTKIMLHSQDTTMVLRDPLNPHSLYNLDLETGKVVEEWQISNSIAVSDFVPRTKFSQMNPESTFVGIAPNSFFTIDPRLSGSKLANDQCKTYAASSKNDFSCAVTTETGHVAVGSSKGEIRLFDSQIGKNAKTLLPSQKDPIIGLDVSKDGNYLIATCPTYLLFVDCMIKTEGKGQGSMGFEKSFPVAAKPSGKRVELKPQHRAFIVEQGIPIRFTPAKFNQGPDSMEKTIVTSVGPFIIAFNLRKLKLGQTDYTLKKYEENIVADNFRWDSDKDIVVTMGSEVILENRKKLSKPDRQSLAGITDINEQDGIVKHWGS